MRPSTLQAFITRHLPIKTEALEQISAAFMPIELGRGEYLLREGKVSDTYLYLESGVMRAYTVDVTGEEVTTALFTGDNVVFEVSSFFLRTPSVEFIHCITDCTGYAISYQELNNLFHSVMEFREFGRMMLVKSFAGFKQRALSLINQTAEERYEQLVSSRGDLIQSVPLKYIASYLGITDTSLSRIRREFTKNKRPNDNNLGAIH